MARIGGIDPQRVMIVFEAEVVGWGVRHRLEGCPPVLALAGLHPHHPHPLVVGGVDAGMRVVHGARIGPTHPSPRRARVFGAIGASLGGMFHGGDQHIRLGRCKGETDAAFVAGWDARLNAHPRGSTVARLPDATAGTAAIEAEGGAQPGVCGGVQQLRVARVHEQLHRPGDRIHREHLGPGHAGVGGFVHPSFGCGTPQISQSGHPRHVRVARMRQHARDTARLPETGKAPRGAAVGGAIDATAPGAGLAVVLLTGAGPDHLGINRRNGHIPEGILSRFVEDRRPENAVIGGSPQATAGGGHEDR